MVCVCVCVWNEERVRNSRRASHIVFDTLIPLPFAKQRMRLLPTVPGSFKTIQTNEISFFLSFFHAMADTQSLHLYFNLRHSS